MVLAFGWTPGIPEIIVILVVALLLFGKRLPEVARSMGKGIVEFKRGLRNVEDDIERESTRPPTLPQSVADLVPTTPLTDPKELEAPPAEDDAEAAADPAKKAE